jgi:hypothetical protein
VSVDVTPGQVSAEDRERAVTSERPGAMAPPPGSLRCASCDGPALRFPSGSIRCVTEGRDLADGETSIQPD